MPHSACLKVAGAMLPLGSTSGLWEGWPMVRPSNSTTGPNQLCLSPHVSTVVLGHGKADLQGYPGQNVPKQAQIWP